MPAIAKILLIFASVLVLARVKVPLGLALVLGGIALNLAARLGMADTALNLAASFSTAELWLFVGIVVLIIEIGRFMTEKRNAGELVAATQRWGGRHGHACSLVALPAVIGLVPMPAGALFSAPLVDQAGASIGAASDWKAAVNYWFRHIWEHWWPLYPGVIVAMSVFAMDAWKFVLVQLPATAVATAAGYYFLLRPQLPRLAQQPAPARGSGWRALVIMLPLILVIASMFVLPPALESLLPAQPAQTRKMLAVLLGLLAGLAAVVADDRRSGRRDMFSTLFTRKSLGVLTSLAGVLVFKGMLDRSGLLPVAARELVSSGIPVFLAVALLPLLAGLITGLAAGFAGASFPLVVGLLDTPGTGLTPGATVVLAYGFGYAGMMLSPVHLCLLVTRDYFGADLLRFYRHVRPCVLAMMAYALAAYALLNRLGL